MTASPCDCVSLEAIGQPYRIVFRETDHPNCLPGRSPRRTFDRITRWYQRALKIGEAAKMPQAAGQKSTEDERVFEGYRRWGYLAANLDPLGFLAPIVHPELIVDGDAAAAARKIYCGTIGTEFEHI